MKLRTSLALTLILLSAGSFHCGAAETGPIRILHIGREGTDSAKHAHVLMRELGRDAIWFDYTTNPEAITPDYASHFDAVLLDVPKGSGGAIAGPKQVVIEFTGDEKTWASAAFLSAAKAKLLQAVGPNRQMQWESFLAGREPEKREPSPTIANYEGRPQPITLQHPFTVKGSLERTQVPADLRLELFAAEPDIAKPIAFAWDERGRLWVAETRDYPHVVQPDGVGADSIKICEDTDGDGRADKFTVFADKLNIPTGLVFVKGGVLIAQSPRFIFLKDSNGDDRADTREVILEGWGIRDTHAQASTLHWGHDNWLYGCVGYSGYDGTVGGKALKFGMGTYRFKADGSALEFLHQFSNNAWGHSANAAGDQFGGTANNAPLFFGGIPAHLAPSGIRVMSAKKINEVDTCHTITPNFRQVDVFGGFTAAAGSALIESASLPPRLQGMAMICEPTMKVISLLNVQRKGAGYTARDAFNLVASTDEWMSPVFAEVGPDGAVWFADWQNFIIQHNPTPSTGRGGYDAKTGVGGAHENPLRDHARGRIYRVVWNQAKPPALKPLKNADTADLVKALGHDTQYWRLTAQRLLVEEKRDEAADALKKLTLANDGSVAAIHALWTLHGLGKLDDPTHRAALLAKDAALRRNASRALSADPRGKQLFFSSGVISDPDLTTRLAGLVKLAEFETSKDIQTVVASLSRAPENKTDEWLSEATKLLVRKHRAQTFKEGPNLLPNPGFETVGADGLPEGWKRRDYGGREANQSAQWQIVSGPGMARSGKNAMLCITRGDADTSFHTDVALKPNTEYRLSGWIKAQALRGNLSLNDHLGRAQTEKVTDRDRDWTQVEVTFNSRERTRASINILQVARGDGYWDDVKLCEILPVEDAASLLAADPKRGEHVFYKHTAACVLCHSLKGEGSTVGPPLDGIALKPKDYLLESLINPSAKLAPGYEQLGVSPMPPMNVVLNEQEMADVVAFLETLKTPLPPGTVIKANLPSFE